MIYCRIKKMSMILLCLEFHSILRIYFDTFKQSNPKIDHIYTVINLSKKKKRKNCHMIFSNQQEYINMLLLVN